MGRHMNPIQKKICWGEAVVPGIALVFVIAFFLQTRDAPSVAVYWPFITAAGGGALWCAIFFKFILAGTNGPAPAVSKKGSFAGSIERPGMLLVGSVAYIAVVPLLGFSLSSLAFLLLLFRGLGSRRWLKSFVVAFGIAAILHLALVVFMKLSLPQLDLGFFSI